MVQGEMLRIKQKRWRMGVRLLFKTVSVGSVLFAMFGVIFGLSKGVDGDDGSLLLFCRVCRDYSAGDVMLMQDGRTVEYGENEGGVVAGKVIAKLSVRGFTSEVSE